MTTFRFITCLVIVSLTHGAFSQTITPKATAYVKINLSFKRVNSETFSLSNFQPALLFAGDNTAHEVGLTNLYYGKSYAFSDYEPVKSFHTGMFYLIKRRILPKESRFDVRPGLSASFDYTARHLIPRKPQVHKEMHQDIFTYSAFATLSLSYRIAGKLSADCDFPILLWNAQYFLQKDLAPVTKDVSYRRAGSARLDILIFESAFGCFWMECTSSSNRRTDLAYIVLYTD
jgi:hypothetical protein